MLLATSSYFFLLKNKKKLSISLDTAYIYLLFISAQYLKYIIINYPINISNRFKAGGAGIFKSINSCLCLAPQLINNSFLRFLLEGFSLMGCLTFFISC